MTNDEIPNDEGQMTKYGMTLLVCMFWSLSACGQGPGSFTANVSSDKVALGDTVTLSLNFAGSEEPTAPQLAPIADVDIMPQAPSTQRQTSIEMINGRMRRMESIVVSFQYLLTPKKLGSFTIPAVVIKSKGKAYSTQPITVQVVQAVPQEHVLVDLLASKTEVSVDEQVVLTVRFSFDDPRRVIADENSYCGIPWLLSLEGFAVEPPEEFVKGLKGDGVLVVNAAQRAPFEVTRTGTKERGYVVYSLSKTVFPTSQGERKIPACTFKCQYAQSVRRTDNFFFGTQVIPEDVQAVFARSNDLTIKVKPLPETGRPSEFQGAVGEYKMEVTVEPRSVRACDPITVTARISGVGNVQGISAPRLPDSLTSFKTYAGDVKTSTSKEGGKIVGSKTFALILEPQSADVKEAPAVTFAYFNPRVGRYETVREGPFPISVRPAEEVERRGLAPLAKTAGRRSQSAPKGAAMELTKDIMPIATDLAGLTNQAGSDHLLRLLVFLVPAPWVLAGAVLMARRWRERLRMDAGYARASRALRAARRKLAEARKLADSSPAKETCDSVARAISEFIADKLNLPAASVSSVSARELLIGRGADSNTVDEIVAFFTECDRVRFSADGPQGVACSDLVDKAEGLLRRLDGLL